MTFFISIFYIFFFLWGFWIYDVHKKAGITFSLLCILFLSKVLFGILNLYFHNSEYIGNDAHNFYKEAIFYLKDFDKNASFYFKDWLFNWGAPWNKSNFLNPSYYTTWSDIGRLMHFRLMVLCNIFTLGNEYANVVIFNVVYFIGSLALLKSFSFFQRQRKNIFILFIFFIPSITFWCSGIHKDGLMLSFFGLVLWRNIQYFENKNLKNLLLLILSLFLLFCIRYFYFLIFFPFYIIYLIFRNKKYLSTILITSSFVFVLAFFAFGNSSLNTFNFIKEKQTSFFKQRGYSDVSTPKLENNTQSYLNNIPIALKHIFIEPINQFGKKIKYDITALDNLLILFLYFYALFLIYKNKKFHGIPIMIILFSMACLFFIGLTVPNLGTIVRYKSPFILLILCSLFSLSSGKTLFDKVEKLFGFK